MNEKSNHPIFYRNTDCSHKNKQIIPDGESFLCKHLRSSFIERFTIFIALLKKWNKRNRFIAHSTIPNIWTRHILDSVQLFPLRPASPYRWVDIGTGGGFPGIILCILAAGVEEKSEIVLVEPNRQKSEFLKHVVRELGLKSTVINERIENLDKLQADVISARALAKLNQLFRWSCSHLKSNGYALFPKGVSGRGEVLKARTDWVFQTQEIPSWIQSDSVIFKISLLREANKSN